MQNRKSHFHLHIRSVPALVFIVAVAAAAGYAVWSKAYLTEDEYFPYVTRKSRTQSIDTKDWKSYRNEIYGFGISYPKEFTAVFAGGPKTLDLNPSAKDTGLAMAIKDNTAALNMAGWWKQNSAYRAGYVVENVEGSAGIKTYSADKRVYDSYVFLPRDGSVYEFHWTVLDERIADEILSTFYYFPPITPKDPMAEWETYRSQQHGFVLKHPSDVSVLVQTDASVRFTQKGAPANGLPVIFIHSQEVSIVSQLWLNDVLPNYALTPNNKPVLDGITASTAAGRGEYGDHTLYIIPKDSGTSALIEVSNSGIGKQILSTFKFN